MTAAPTVDCAHLVPDIVDAAPVRSPQALHSIIASRVANKSLVEIGTRNGDGVACFSQLAASAIARACAASWQTRLPSYPPAVRTESNTRWRHGAACAGAVARERSGSAHARAQESAHRGPARR